MDDREGSLTSPEPACVLGLTNLFSAVFLSAAKQQERARFLRSAGTQHFRDFDGGWLITYQVASALNDA